jgi:hypothetical protein
MNLLDLIQDGVCLSIDDIGAPPIRISTNRNQIENLLASVGALFKPREDATCSWALGQLEGGRRVAFATPKRLIAASWRAWSSRMTLLSQMGPVDTPLEISNNAIRD